VRISTVHLTRTTYSVVTVNATAAVTIPRYECSTSSYDTTVTHNVTRTVYPSTATVVSVLQCGLPGGTGRPPVMGTGTRPTVTPSLPLTPGLSQTSTLTRTPTISPSLSLPLTPSLSVTLSLPLTPSLPTAPKVPQGNAGRQIVSSSITTTSTSHSGGGGISISLTLTLPTSISLPLPTPSTTSHQSRTRTVSGTVTVTASTPTTRVSYSCAPRPTTATRRTVGGP
jgi:hypothetical protein